MEKEKVIEEFRNYLKKSGQRITKERMTLLEYIICHPGHLDADDLYIQMKINGIKISRATVYNTLQLLYQLNIITRSDFGELHQHYETNYGGPQHHHLVCQNCKNVIEIHDDRIEKIVNDISKKQEFSKKNYIFQITGLCKQCSKQK
jgi:Fur family transcriptional regulator, ferric uptake regulator